MLLSLGRDLLLQVLEYLDPVSLACVCCSCRNLRETAEDTQLWHSLCKSRWNNLNEHVFPVPGTLASCDWKRLYGYQNGWKQPEASFCQARVGGNCRQQIQCFEVCKATDIGTSSVDGDETLLLTHCIGSELPHLNGLRIHTLPSSAAPRGASIGDSTAFESLFTLSVLPCGVAAGSIDTTFLLGFEDVQGGRIRCREPVAEFSLPNRCACLLVVKPVTVQVKSGRSGPCYVTVK